MADEGKNNLDSEWLGREFDQNFEHLRHEQTAMITVAHAYLSVVVAAIAIAGGVGGTGLEPTTKARVGLGLLGIAALGVVSATILLARRVSEVQSARQLNAIRKWYTEHTGVEPSVILRPTTPGFPEVFRMRSDFTWTYLTVLIAIGAAAGVGAGLRNASMLGSVWADGVIAAAVAAAISRWFVPGLDPALEGHP